MPEEQKDWHPGSNKQVLDLVHPSLYPLVYGKTLGKQPDGSIGTFAPPSPSSRSPGDPAVEYGLRDAEVLRSYISPRFQWLPSDFEVREDGGVGLVSSYINNVPPEHAKQLVPVLERVAARAVPLWERVLGDLRRGEPKMRLGSVLESKSWYGASKGLDCVWRDGEPEDPPEDDEYYAYPSLEWETYLARRDAWFAGKPMALPEAPGEYDGRLLEGREVFSLRGRKIQVITKLANIVLGPGNPTYPGGTWHVEGTYCSLPYGNIDATYDNLWDTDVRPSQECGMSGSCPPSSTTTSRRISRIQHSPFARRPRSHCTTVRTTSSACGRCTAWSETGRACRI